MKKWPKDGSPVSLREIISELRKAILFAYRIERINKNRNIPYGGYDIGDREKVVAFSPNIRLKLKNLKKKETEQGRDALDEILTIAVQLGIEQGRRIFKTSSEYQLKCLLNDKKNALARKNDVAMRRKKL